MILYFLVQAFNLWTLVAEISGLTLIIRDDGYRNSVIHGALVLNAATFVIGLRVARRIRLHFAKPSY